MSGTNGQRPLFSNAPITPAAPMIPTVAPGSNLAAAMMGGQHPGMNLQAPNFAGQIPLASIMQMMKGQDNPTPGHNQSGLIQQPDGSWAPGPSMGGQMPTLSVAPGMPGGPAPGVPGGAMMPGTPTGQAPGVPGGLSPGVPGPEAPGLFGQTMDWLRNYTGGGGG